MSTALSSFARETPFVLSSSVEVTVYQRSSRGAQWATDSGQVPLELDIRAFHMRVLRKWILNWMLELKVLLKDKSQIMAPRRL